MDSGTEKKKVVVIAVPDSLDLPSALQFSIEISSLAEVDEYVFDFRRTGQTEPFGMLLISSEIRRLVQHMPRTKISCINYEKMSYAAHMGFFQAFGLNHGKSPGEAKGSARYIPFRIFDCETLEREAARKGVEVGDEIEENSKELAEVLCGAKDGAMFETLSYSLRELMRNVIEHSQSKQFGLCAQYWPSKNKVEVAILDRGIGLRESLKNNPNVDVSTDKNAINYALMPGVSGKAYKGARKQRSLNWKNSGFGLYMTNRIARNGGTFFLATGTSGLLLTKGAKTNYGCNIIGTAIRMVVKTNELAGLKDSLNQFRGEAQEFQKQFAELVYIDPSAASLMLSEDFKVSTWQKIRARLGLG